MTLCITADGKTLESQVNPTFGRTPFFFLVPGTLGAGQRSRQWLGMK